MQLNPEQEALHKEALSRMRKYKEYEWQVIEILQKVEQTGLYKALECPTLFIYAVKFLDLDSALAYAMIRAARLSQQFPRLEYALKAQKLSVTKAARFFSTLNPQNANELISFAENSSTDEINREVSRIRKRDGLPEKTRKLEVSDETYALIKRARSLTQKSNIDQTLKHIVNEHLDRHDPVRKAKRAQLRKKATNANNRKPNSKRIPLTADENHQVFARDGGQCTHRDAQGRRCVNDRYLHIHHIRPVSLGGTNDPLNLTTLCSFHHDLVHQLSLPLEGQITWLRDVRVGYG